MKTLLILSAVMSFGVVAPIAVAAGPTASEIAAAGAKYRKTCLHCHQPPDLRFATERAWLDQVNRTA